MYVPPTYASGAPLSGTATFSSQTLTSVGANVGTYTWTLPNDDTITLRVGNSVPEPGTVAILTLGVVGLGVTRRITTVPLNYRTESVG